MADTSSLTAAGYVERQPLILVVSASHAPASASAPLAIAIDSNSNPRFVHSPQFTQAASRTAASATSFRTGNVVNCSSGHACQMHTYQNVHRKCSVCRLQIENLSIGSRCNTCDYDVCQECVCKSRTPTFNPSTEWLDEHGRICPKAVDYASQCPKGHALVAFTVGGSASVQRVVCRVCHSFTVHERASQWLTCNVSACCGSYAVCNPCVRSLPQTPSAVSESEGFSFSVIRFAAGAYFRFRSCVLF
jgi:hypothetical protein